MNIIIGIGEYAISDNENDVLKTFALGSCIAVTMYSARKKVLGLVHIALPFSNINPEESYLRPGHYVDTAIPLLLNKLKKDYQCNKNEIIVSIYGGSDSTLKDDMFRIGKRNIEAVKSLLAVHYIASSKEDTGGRFSRNIEADVATGTVKMVSYHMKR